MRATNWVGDAVMSLPALAAIRARFPAAHIAVLARPWVAGLYRREPFADEIIEYQPAAFRRGSLWPAWRERRRAAAGLREREFDCALLLPNAFDAALVTALAGIPERIGYARDGRSLLLTRAVAVPRRGAIPEHESYYYLELLRRAGWIERLPESLVVELQSAPAARLAGLRRLEELGVKEPVVGLSPGAAFGAAKRWLPERFAGAAIQVARALGAAVLIHGSAGERELCASVGAAIAAEGIQVLNLAGQTTLEVFLDLAAVSRVYMSNDSGAMHVASALGVPTVAVFGSTNPRTTGPAGRFAAIVSNPVECSPCMLRECPIDHRCMTAVGANEVASAALNLIKQASK